MSKKIKQTLPPTPPLPELSEAELYKAHVEATEKSRAALAPYYAKLLSLKGGKDAR